MAGAIGQNPEASFKRFCLTFCLKRLIFANFEPEDYIWNLKEARPMYAVLKSGGKQYKVEEGQVLRLEKISGDVGFLA